MSHYISIEECVSTEQHLKSCDQDGYCNACGEQGDGKNEDE